MTYGAVSRTIQYISDTANRPQLATFALAFPNTTANILETFRAYLKDIPRQPGRKVVAVIDAIISNPGVHLPWQEMVKICKEENVWSIVDAAHAIGQELGINLKDADPDFWISVGRSAVHMSFADIPHRTAISGFLRREDAQSYMSPRGS